MHRSLYCLAVILFASFVANAQQITYSQTDKSDTREMNFEILGNYNGTYPIYKNIYKHHELAIYDSNMALKEIVPLEFISDHTYNIDFISYPESIVAIWQYEKGNITYCKGVKMTGDGKVIGAVRDLDTTKTGIFSAKVNYNMARSDDKKSILVYKVISKSNEYSLVTKVYDENLQLRDSSKHIINYNDNREFFDDLLIADNGEIVFSKLHERNGASYISDLDLNFKKLHNDTLYSVPIDLKKHLIKDPFLKIDNSAGRVWVTSFAYRNNNVDVEGLFSSAVDEREMQAGPSVFTVFSDTLLQHLSGRPDWRTAYNNFALRNVVLTRNGFIVVSEEYFKQRRYSNLPAEGYYPGAVFPYNYNYNYRYGMVSDYYLYNRGYYGYYRPYDDNYSRDVIFNYNDVLNFSFDKNAELKNVSVINKTTSDIENDNFLSFSNLNAGSEMHFLFLQKDNNREIMSDHALQPDGSIIRYPTIKGGEAGYDLMPRLGRQTGRREMIIPCLIRNNIVFAKIDF